jgi:hypothetical protein
MSTGLFHALHEGVGTSLFRPGFTGPDASKSHCTGQSTRCGTRRTTATLTEQKCTLGKDREKHVADETCALTASRNQQAVYCLRPGSFELTGNEVSGFRTFSRVERIRPDGGDPNPHRAEKQQRDCPGNPVGGSGDR